ncbi:hypothetical protein COLO4_23086 [Corchorus olitorius]|uniref:DEUBAD domain-containing protein n=1 Tax=Corchorus olitorius TaxID=93759 RepID=A0A1R3IIK9_9ROSI|nr:hypothetical protein COLO4_23086 [Corchorus olitorius]
MGIQKIHHLKSGGSSSQSHIPGSLKCEAKGKEDHPVFGADSGDDLDDCDLKEISCELGMVEGQICSIPYELFDLPDLKEILSLNSWNSCLTEEERFSLSAYLPDMDQQTFWLTLKELFSGSDMHFGNPLDAFFQRLKGGFYHPQITCLRQALQFLEGRKFHHALRSYHDKMTQTHIDMRRLWDECDMSVGVEERLYMWRTRRKRKDTNLLDLNAVPNDGCLLNEDVHADAIRCNLPKRMKTLESVRAKNIVASPSTNGMNIIAPNYSTKGVLKVKTYGNANHNQKIVLGDISEQCRTVPKGLLKVVPKGPSVQPELPKVFPNRSQTASLVGAQDLQDCKVSYSPASLYLGNAGGFSGTPFLWQKVSGSKLNLEQPQCALSRQDGTFRSSRYLQSSGEDISKEVDISDLDKHKLFGHDEESVTGSKRYNFGGQSLWQNFGLGKKKLFERSLELYPFSDQFHEEERHSRIMPRECITIFPRVSEAVSRNSGIGGGLQEKLMAFPNQMKSPCDYSLGNSENSSKPGVSERLKYDLTLPLTYKRRKPQAKNSSDFAHSLMKDTEIRAGNPKESKRLSGENLKALKFNMTSYNNNPYLAISPVPSSGRTPMGRICEALNRCGKKAEALADSVWNHRHQQWMYYKVVVELDKLATVDPSANRLNPSEKYIHIVTTDGYEFWLMGFISYDKALKSLNEALRHSRHESSIPVL